MDTDGFERERRRLFALAYRILGSAAEAEDAVQDTYLKWHAADRDAIACAPAWLTTCCTRQCIDMLHSARRARTDYVGTWLPEPLHMVDDQSPDQLAEQASSVGTAFMLMLERLSPRERAAYLLHEVLDMGYADVAAALSSTEAACRQLVARAKARLGKGGARVPPPPRERQQQLLLAFQRALTTGQLQPLVSHLAEDIVLCADGGGKASTIASPVQGRPAVADALRMLSRHWRQDDWQPALLSGSQGFLLWQDGRLETAVSFAFGPQPCIAGLYIVRNPDKLERLSALVQAPR